MHKRVSAPNLPRWGQRFEDEEKLRALTRAHCAAEWQQFAHGEPWSERWQLYFDPPPSTVQATRERTRAPLEALLKARGELRAAAGEGTPADLLALLDDPRWGFAEPPPPPLDLNCRRRLVANHHERAFLEMGRRATPRELAIVSLLIGNFPETIISNLRRKGGFTVSEVIAAEKRAISEAKATFPGLKDEIRASKLPGHRPKPRPAES